MHLLGFDIAYWKWMFIPEHTVTREGLFGYFCSCSDSETVINYLTNCQVSSELEHVHFLCHVAVSSGFQCFFLSLSPFSFSEL